MPCIPGSLQELLGEWYQTDLVVCIPLLSAS